MSRHTKIFGRRLADAREKKAMTQRELGEAVGCSDETISRIERHEVAGIWTKRLPKLALALGVTLDDFKSEICVSAAGLPASGGSRGDAAGSTMPSGLQMNRALPARALPEFHIGIAASRRVDKFAEYPDANRLAATSDRRAFAAPVDGDCQHPKWKNGEVVIFSFDAVEREGILPGSSYYLAFTDGSTTFKRVFTDENDPEIYVLRCWNRQKYPADQRIHRDEVVRIARAISKQTVVNEKE